MRSKVACYWHVKNRKRKKIICTSLYKKTKKIQVYADTQNQKKDKKNYNIQTEMQNKLNINRFQLHFTNRKVLHYIKTLQGIGKENKIIITAKTEN